jgi:hypothetical protein
MSEANKTIIVNNEVKIKKGVESKKLQIFFFQIGRFIVFTSVLDLNNVFVSKFDLFLILLSTIFLF